MKTSLQHHDPMGWSFETFLTPAMWNPAAPRADLQPLAAHPVLRGGIIGAGAFLAALFAFQGVPAGQGGNVIAAWLAAGGIVLAATAVDADRPRTFAALSLAAIAAIVLAAMGIATAPWLLAAAIVQLVAGIGAAAGTPFRAFFAAWAWFHGGLAAALVL